MSSTFGQNLKLSIFGQSHGIAIGMTLDGIPAGLPVDLEKLYSFLSRRAPGRDIYSTARKEADVPEFVSGILNNFTCGAPIAAWIRNTNTRSEDYNNLMDCPRPGHADYTAQMKYKGFQDVAGGGHFSGRLTAPLCIAGGLCKQWLSLSGIEVTAHLYSIGNVKDKPFSLLKPEINSICKDFPVIDMEQGIKMKQTIESAKKSLDSIGGIIECAVTGLPAGIGEPMFDGIENRIASAVFAVPAVKGIEFGDGFAASAHLGSEINDGFFIDDGKVSTLTNHAGGILGGISSGSPVVFRAAIKPTPSIGKPQNSVSLSKMENKLLEIKGRHDPCIAPRAVPVIEAAAAIAIYDLFLGAVGH